MEYNNGKTYTTNVKKWFSISLYWDIQTGERIPLTDLNNYAKIRCKKKHEIIEELKKNHYEKIGQTTINWFCLRNEQTKLEI